MEKKLVELIHKQINGETYSAYLYFSMSSWAEHAGWKGFAHWLTIQAQEELVHAMTLHGHLIERNERSTFDKIDAPENEWASILALMKHVLEHEKLITGSINELASAALEVKDHAFYQLIQLFAKEQVEEEDSAMDIITRLQRIEGHPYMIENLDKELGARVFINPFPATT